MKTSIQKQLLICLIPLAGAKGCSESKNSSDLTTAASKPAAVSPSNTQLANKQQATGVAPEKSEIPPTEAVQPPQITGGLKDQVEEPKKSDETNENNGAGEGSRESRGNRFSRIFKSDKKDKAN